MTLLDRMLLQETRLPLLVGLCAILQLLVLGQLLQLNEIVFGGAVTLGDLTRVTLGLLPHFLVLALPIAFVLGIQLAIGRLAADRELLALAAAGRSPLALYRVPVLIALLFGLATFALARWAEPLGLKELNGVLDEVLERNLETGLVPGLFNSQLPRMVLYFQGAQKSSAQSPRWQGVLLEDRTEDGPPLLALAREGTLRRSGSSLSFELADGELHRSESGGETMARFSSAQLGVDLGGWLSTRNRFATSEAALSADELASYARAMEAQGRIDLARRALLDGARRALAPLSCLAFALLAVPLAAFTGGGRGAAYLTTLLAFAAHFALVRAGVPLVERGAPPWLGALLPELPALLIGCALSLSLVRRGPS